MNSIWTAVAKQNKEKQMLTAEDAEGHRGKNFVILLLLCIANLQVLFYPPSSCVGKLEGSHKKRKKARQLREKRFKRKGDYQSLFLCIFVFFVAIVWLRPEAALISSACSAV